MQIQRVTVEVLETPVNQYQAGGNAVSSNWLALRPVLVKALAQAADELGQLLVGMHVMEIEAARARLEQAGGWVGPTGLLPMAIGTATLGDQPYYPMGRSVMGGLIFSTIGAMIALPLVYSAFEDLRNWWGGIVARIKKPV